MEHASERVHDILAPTRATVVRYFALIAGALVLALLLTSPLRAEPPSVMLSYIGLLATFALGHQLRERHPDWAGAACSLGPFVLVTGLVWLRGGIVHPAGVTAYVTLVAVTGLCWSSRGALVVAALSSLVLAWFVHRGPDDVPYGKLQIWIELSIQLIIISMLVHFALLAISRSSKLAFSAQQSREALEARIAQSKSIEALGRLAGGVAHDFNNMLTIVSGTVELMQARTDLDAAAHEDLEQIEGAARRAAELTSQLLAFGRKQVLKPRVLCPNATLQGLKPLLTRLVRADIQLEVQLDPELGNISADEARLEQVVVNLVSNACDAMQSGGKLTLETENQTLGAAHLEAYPEVEPGDYVRISVRDTGEGMAPETRSRIFEPFFTTKAHRGGTGLGLATVHGIVAQTGGHIVVDSEPNAGTCFHLYFPRRLEPPSVAPRPRAPASWDLRPVKVLLVEDEPMVRLATRRMLEALGHSVSEAEDGLDAINRYSARVQDFDILISDVIMPHVSGPDLAAHMTRLHPELEVLLISGYTANSLVSDVTPSQETRFLSKPFDRQTLANELSHLLAARHD